MTILLLAVGLGAASWMKARTASATGGARPPPRPAPPPPPVEPLELRALSRDAAVAINAAVPFARGPNPAARPFRLKDSGADRARAIDCLAAAMLYEAGAADADGQRAVAQVVINRLRHPAFPKTICGVVFQGQERSTGCQFTFTCDGALARVPPRPAWRAAQQRAERALSGTVFKPVGYSTHYHTDWVVPYWSASLDKVAAVNSHLFFRWAGWWGTPPAFRFNSTGPEPTIARIAFLSTVHRPIPLPTPSPGATGVAALAVLPASKPRRVTTVSAARDTFLVVLDPGASPDSYPALALETCGDRSFCKFVGWTDVAKAAEALPLSDAHVANQAFSYLRNRANSFEKMLWNCAQFKRPHPDQCMKAPPPVPSPSPATTPRTAPAPAPSASPHPLRSPA
ncbi:cell wall hydrolase [Sphingomonas flavalba]|uniref:cell wall hydrolase n=1 Tax=Sphingomonas flavalba TaxID=2559804 RepID=UPI0039E16CE8